MASALGRFLRLVLVFGTIAFIAAEVVLRLGFGLGHPFRYVTHPEIEYMVAPDQDAVVWDTHLKSNAYGMRSDAVEGKKAGDFRVLVLGDSVVNGGHETDHEALATTMLNAPGTIYLNASAVSWGPQNMLAYLDTFGVFDADAIVVVLSSHDAWDAPTFKPLDPQIFRTREPVSVVGEAAWRRLTQYVPALRPQPQPAFAYTAVSDPIAAARTLLGRPRTCLVLHPEVSELTDERKTEGFRLLNEAAGATPVVDGAQYMTPEGYADSIHLNVLGQRQLSQAIAACASLVSGRSAS